jgi:zinc/manganese transport system substrate-binding protein
MSTTIRILLFMCIFLFPFCIHDAKAEKTVIATFSILGDIVKNIGHDRVHVATLVGADGDVHAYEPTPSAAKDFSKADLVVVNGLGLEGWVDRLIKTSGYKGVIVVASTGLKPRKMKNGEHKGGKPALDPHAWQDIDNGKLYVENIVKALIEVDPEGSETYKANGNAYIEKLNQLNTWVKTEFSFIPPQKRRMITTHDAFGYFAGAYDIEILSPMGLSTESEPSAGEVKKLVRQIKEEKITAVFVENVSDPRMTEQIARESGVTIGGKLFSDALSKPDGSAPTYTEMFISNTKKIVAAMKKGL